MRAHKSATCTACVEQKRGTIAEKKTLSRERRASQARVASWIVSGRPHCRPTERDKNLHRGGRVRMMENVKQKNINNRRGGLTSRKKYLHCCIAFFFSATFSSSRSSHNIAKFNKCTLLFYLFLLINVITLNLLSSWNKWLPLYFLCFSLFSVFSTILLNFIKSERERERNNLFYLPVCSYTPQSESLALQTSMWQRYYRNNNNIRRLNIEIL